MSEDYWPGVGDIVRSKHDADSVGLVLSIESGSIALVDMIGPRDGYHAIESWYFDALIPIHRGGPQPVQSAPA